MDSERDDRLGGFDQTNDQVHGLEGDSDGTAASDTESEAEREVTSYGLIGDALGDHHQREEAQASEERDDAADHSA